MTTGREEESAFDSVHQSREFEVFLRILARLPIRWSRVAAFLQASPGVVLGLLGAVTIRKAGHSKSSIHAQARVSAAPSSQSTLPCPLEAI